MNFLIVSEKYCSDPSFICNSSAVVLADLQKISTERVLSDRPMRYWLTRVLAAPFDLVLGALYPLRAAWFIAQTPPLWGYLIAPILVNLGVGLGLYAALLFPGLRWLETWQQQLGGQADAAIAQLPRWLHWLDAASGLLGGLIDVLLMLVLLVLTGLVIVQFGTLLGAPWYGQLAEQIEKQRLGSVPSQEGVLAIVEDLGRAIGFELKKLALTLGLTVLFVLISGVPILGAIGVGAGGLITSTLLVCLDFFDPPLERRRLGFRQKLKTVLYYLPASASFGLVCLLAVSVPIVNLVSIPICMVGGTLFFCDRIFPERFASRSLSPQPPRLP